MVTEICMEPFQLAYDRPGVTYYMCKIWPATQTRNWTHDASVDNSIKRQLLSIVAGCYLWKFSHYLPSKKWVKKNIVLYM